ncbi:MAG: aldo/keto reductase [Megasphaera sp.]|jgi:aryl-alcohol dehydrogenase-like predicted oxidoreductase|nr:aldo/keto reductase [Megasphaera sp.]MCH4187440.1 aldo/keto reductase [Megasphaera sp.]MCH4217359.1 aldo/keto reductase [Megasphaera sp.]
MKYAELGNTGITVSRICVGGMSFGQPAEDFHLWTLDQEHTTAMIAHAMELGVNFIDTANVYSHGTSEAYIGKALKQLGIKRENVVLASKVYFNEGKLKKEAIHTEIDGTLQRLGTEYLDIYQIHRFDYDTPIEETMEALDDLVRTGKVRAIGASAMYGYQFHNMQIVAEKNGWTRFSTMQNHYNLLYREDERELIPICKQYGVSLIPYSPLAGGHLSHMGWTTQSKRSQTDKTIQKKYDQAMDNDLQIINRVHEVAQAYGVSMSQVALAWQFKKGVTAPIVGATSMPHFDDAVAAVELSLTNEDVTFLEEPYARHKIVGALPEE